MDWSKSGEMKKSPVAMLPREGELDEGRRISATTWPCFVRDTGSPDSMRAETKAESFDFASYKPTCFITNKTRLVWSDRARRNLRGLG